VTSTRPTADEVGLTREATRPTQRIGIPWGEGPDAVDVSPKASSNGHRAKDISRVPYLPGLDGMRAFAVVAVMIYHANPDWLAGGYLGVEVFFVISGYLITLLLIAEKERTDTVDMRHFWYRRARRLLPALFTMLLALTIWTSIFDRDALGKLRGDVIAALLYVSNWYQIWTGAGYTAANEFAPLRHLWSLAVEEQFYVVWPLVMFALLRGGSRKIADLSRWLVIAALGITVVTALVYTSGPIGTPEVTPDAYWSVFGREISKFDWSYLGTFSRAGGLLLGAAFAMVWRPVAVMRGPLRTKGPLLDVVALAGFLILAAMAWFVWLIGPDGGNPVLFRGGFLLCAFATLMMIAGVTHERAVTSKVLSIPLLLWIGTRSYGLYLYHWPIYQMIRGIAGVHLNVVEFALAMVATVVVTELSYRFVETPIRKGTVAASWNRVRRSPSVGLRNLIVAGGVVVAAFAVFAGVSLATADVVENEVRESLDEGAAATCDVVNDPTCSGAEPATSDPVGTVVAPVDSAAAPAESVAPDPSGSAAVVPPPDTTTTTVAPVPIAKLALGDSVMLGAAPQLTEQGFIVDAKESRQFDSGADVAVSLRDQGRLGDVVVVHLGTNGTIDQADLNRMLDALSGVPQVLLVTLAVDREWIPGNNAMIYDALATYPNTQLLDWAGLAPACPGDCFASDGFHLRDAGKQYYTSLVIGALAGQG
jgi:peptidoglycan/LPS O-acetylase OafA/YrhL